MKESKISLAFEYRGLERLYEEFLDPNEDLFDSLDFIYDDLIDKKLGVPLECKKNLLLRMKKIRLKLRNINEVFHPHY